MKLPRRQFLHLAAAAATFPPLSRFASAQSYPTRPVHLLEGFGAGGAPDIVARLIGQPLSERLGQSFVVENRSGATGNIAAEAVVRASPDGYTLLLATTGNAINATMLNLSFDFIRDIAPIAGIVRVPLVMEVHPSVPAKTVAEFIAYAKANPGKVNMASAGTGSTTHVAGEMFKTMAGVDLFHVPYRGAQVFPALLTGEAQVIWPATLIDRICQGRQFPRPGGNDGGALANIAGRSSSRRNLAGLRGKCMVRHWRSKAHAERSHRNTEQGSQRQHRRSEIPGTACQSGRHGSGRVAGRLRQTDLRRGQEVEQGEFGGQMKRERAAGNRRAAGFRPAYVGSGCRIRTYQRSSGGRHQGRHPADDLRIAQSTGSLHQVGHLAHDLMHLCILRRDPLQREV